jgi:glucan 1,3-beta-glucosidase
VLTNHSIADDTDAINRAISQMSLTNQALRCGWLTKCGSTTTQGALVYFPVSSSLFNLMLKNKYIGQPDLEQRGKYLIKKPIIHYYYTQLVGDAITKPTIVASPDFGLSDLSAVLAMIESNPYVPGEGGPPPNCKLNSLTTPMQRLGGLHIY